MQKCVAFNDQFNAVDNQVALSRMKRKMSNTFETQLSKTDHNDLLL